MAECAFCTGKIAKTQGNPDWCRERGLRSPIIFMVAHCARQTLNGVCARNAPVLPSVNRFGDWVGGMAALMRAWNLP